MNKYTTIQGDTWDLIAYKLWQSEYLFPLLMEANIKHIDTVIFSGGVVLNVPEIEVEDEEIITERPEWLDDEDDDLEDNDDLSEYDDESTGEEEDEP